MMRIADLRPDQTILYAGNPYKVVSIRSVKDEVHVRLYYLECQDEKGERVSLTVREGAAFTVSG